MDMILLYDEYYITWWPTCTWACTHSILYPSSARRRACLLLYCCQLLRLNAGKHTNARSNCARGVNEWLFIPDMCSSILLWWPPFFWLGDYWDIARLNTDRTDRRVFTKSAAALMHSKLNNIQTCATGFKKQFLSPGIAIHFPLTWNGREEGAPSTSGKLFSYNSQNYHVHRCQWHLFKVFFCLQSTLLKAMSEAITIFSLQFTNKTCQITMMCSL